MDAYLTDFYTQAKKAYVSSQFFERKYLETRKTKSILTIILIILIVLDIVFLLYYYSFEGPRYKSSSFVKEH